MTNRTCANCVWLDTCDENNLWCNFHEEVVFGNDCCDEFKEIEKCQDRREFCSNNPTYCRICTRNKSSTKPRENFYKSIKVKFDLDDLIKLLESLDVMFIYGEESGYVWVFKEPNINVSGQVVDY